MLALLLNVKIRGQAIYRTLIFLPSLIPAVASAMLWLWLFNSKLGLVNFVLRGMGMKEPPGWLTDVHWALPSLVIISFWGVGNTVVIFLAGLQDVPKELYEAADLDGANRLQALRHVTLPSISPVIFFNLIMGIIGTLQVFRASVHHDAGRAGAGDVSLYRVHVRQRVRIFEDGLLQRDGVAAITGCAGPYRDRISGAASDGCITRTNESEARKSRGMRTLESSAS